MKIIALSKRIGEHLGQRTIAAEFRDELIQMNEPVQLDFTGVKMISYSFAHEFFGKLIDECGADVFRHRVVLKNMRPEGHAMLSSILKTWGGSRAA